MRIEVGVRGTLSARSNSVTSDVNVGYSGLRCSSVHCHCQSIAPSFKLDNDSTYVNLAWLSFESRIHHLERYPIGHVMLLTVTFRRKLTT